MTTTTALRLQATQAAMADQDTDLLFIAPSADLRYLAGFRGHASERPALLVVRPNAPAILLLPQLEAAGAGDLDDVRLVTYEETDDPYAVLAGALRAEAGGRAAIGDETRAAVLLGLQARFPHLTFRPASPLLAELRRMKTDTELQLLREAGRKADAAFAQLLQSTFAGRREREVAAELSDLLVQQGLQRAEWGPVIGSGPNSASPHHGAGERTIQEGDAVVLDFGGALEGYQADITRTVHVGTPGDEFRHVYEIVQQAQQAGVAAVRPGIPAQEIDRVTRGVIRAAGYADVFIHRTGHGLGLDTHEEPYIIEGNTLPLAPGMVFSVEPGIYLPRRFGVRIEDIVAVTPEGGERLNHAPRELQIVR